MESTPTETLTRPASLHDVARTAGVSASTVSRYLSGQLPLRADTETRIREAITQLGYAPSRTKLAKASSAKSDAPSLTVGVIIPHLGDGYFGPIADEIVAAAEAQGWAVLVAASFSHKRREASYLDLMSSLSVDGVIFAGNFASNPTLGRVISSGMPVVVIDEAISELPPVDMVLVDDYAGAYHATTHLASLGHKSIALVTGPRNLHSVKERSRGYRDALKRVGIDPGTQFVSHGDFSEEFGAAALSHVLSSEHRPTAVFAASDTIALGMMRAARGLGIHIPENLSLVGFDDAPSAGLVTPRLTTVRTAVDKLAASAVALLTERMHDPTRSAETRIVSVSLVEGDSAQPLN